jgi:hypothetical protein
MYQADVTLIIESACDARLVRDYSDWDVCLVEATDGVGCARLELDALDMADVVIVLNDSAVTVEQDAGPRGCRH